MEKLSFEMIPGLIVLNSGYVTAVSTTDEELSEEKTSKKQTTARPTGEFITLDAGYSHGSVTRSPRSDGVLPDRHPRRGQNPRRFQNDDQMADGPVR